MAMADPASVDATAPLAAAPAPTPAPAPGGEVWRFRTLHVGLITPQSELTRYTLHLQGSEATLVVEHQLLRGSQADVVGGAWQTSRTETLRGTARQKGAALELELTGSGRVYALGCKRTRGQVAVARAVRIPDPASGQECGNEGTWSPAKKVRKELLRCEGGELGRLELGRGAGLELLSVNDDCVMQGRGVREVAEDGAIAPPRAPEGPDQGRS
jgi:hypothetical protein